MSGSVGFDARLSNLTLAFFEDSGSASFGVSCTISLYLLVIYSCVCEYFSTSLAARFMHHSFSNLQFALSVTPQKRQTLVMNDSSSPLSEP